MVPVIIGTSPNNTVPFSSLFDLIIANICGKHLENELNLLLIFQKERLWASCLPFAGLSCTASLCQTQE